MNSASEQSPKANAAKASRNSTQQPHNHERNTNTSPADILSEDVDSGDYTEAEARILTMAGNVSMLGLVLKVSGLGGFMSLL